MRKTAAFILLAALAITPAAMATPSWNLQGIYVEARSAQVFIGGCIWNSEAMTVGREAVMAWKIEQGDIDGIDMAGLSVVAAIAGSENLAINPEAARRTVLYIDQRATAAQREALARAYMERNAGMFGDVVAIETAPITFAETHHGYRVAAGNDVALETEALHVDHKSFERCGEAQWYEPFVPLLDEQLGIAVQHAYRGTALNARWSDPDKQSAFFGRFGS